MGLYSIRNENDDIARCAHVHEFADPACTEAPLALASVGGRRVPDWSALGPLKWCRETLHRNRPECTGQS